MTAAELLAECEEAISACLKSQAYTVAERSQRRAELDKLMATRRELMQEVQVSSSGGQMASVGQIDYPT